MSIARAKGPRGKADKLFSELVRSKGFCLRCRRTDNLQCSHIRSRRFSATRTDLANAQCLCAGCHRYFTDNPVEFTDWLDATIGRDEYLRLKRKSEASGKFGTKFWEAEVERLKGLKEAA